MPCAFKGCPWPPVEAGLCRLHHSDATRQDEPTRPVDWANREDEKGEPIPGKTNFERVLEAVRAGHATSAEVSLATGIKPRVCAGYIATHVRRGKIRCAGVLPRDEHQHGETPRIWEPVRH